LDLRTKPLQEGGDDGKDPSKSPSTSPTNRRSGPTTKAMAKKIQEDWIQLLMVEKPPNICSKMS